MPVRASGYAGRLLRVNLSREEFSEEVLDEATQRKWVGGASLGAMLLYREVGPGITWSAPGNTLIMASGPLGGTHLGGSGTYSVVSMGALTGGASSSQAGGYMGAYMKFSGFDAILCQGQAKRWVYLYLHDGTAELRDASHLIGKDTFETEELIKKELGKHQHGVAVHAIGPAGENLVKFAAIVGDGGHVAGRNGLGAVMGSKRLKAVAADRGKGSIGIWDAPRLSHLRKDLLGQIKNDPLASRNLERGTKFNFESFEPQGILPVRNLTTTRFPQHRQFARPGYQDKVEFRPHRCWACTNRCCNRVKIKNGLYAGFEGEEPDYQLMVAFGSVIGNPDPLAAITLNDEVDRLGLEADESGWLMAWVIECFERGFLTKKHTDGLEMTWGNVEAVRAMLRKIARREGFGDFLAEGVMRASQAVGGEAANCAVYVGKGNSPRGNTNLTRWIGLLDAATSDHAMSDSSSVPHPEQFGLAPLTDSFSPENVPAMLAKTKGISFVNDSLTVCNWTVGYFLAPVVELLNSVTGWDFTTSEAIQLGKRAATLLRVFNLKHGLTPDLEYLSPRLGSTAVDGPAQGRSIMPHWERMLDNYYRHMGWERESGKPLPQTLRDLGLDNVISDLWGSDERPN